MAATKKGKGDNLCCDQCQTSLECIRRCLKCKRAAYCNVACQKAAWPTHKAVCVKWLPGTTSSVPGETSKHEHECMVCQDRPDISDAFLGLLCMRCTVTICEECTDALVYGSTEQKMCPACRFEFLAPPTTPELKAFVAKESTIPPRRRVAFGSTLFNALISMKVNIPTVHCTIIFANMIINLSEDASKWVACVQRDKQVPVSCRDTADAGELYFGNMICAYACMGVLGALEELEKPAKLTKSTLDYGMNLLILAMGMGSQRAAMLIPLGTQSETKLTHALLDSMKSDIALLHVCSTNITRIGRKQTV
jgi:hypothetical protein